MSRIRRTAGVVLGLWAAFWGFFAVASAGGLPPWWIAILVVVTLLGVPLLAWRLHRIGGALLLAEGCLLLTWVLGYLRNRPETTLFLVVTFCLPPMVAGALMLTERGPRSAPRGKQKPA